MIVTDGYLETFLNAATTCEGILSGNKEAFEALMNRGEIRKIVGDVFDPRLGTKNGKPTRIEPSDHESFAYELGTAFHMIAAFAEEEDLAPPLLSQAGALRTRVAAAIETGETLELTDEETAAAGKVLEFVTRMKLGQLERITDAFRDARAANLDKQIAALEATEWLVLKLKNALGYANAGSLNLRSAGQLQAWELVERVKSNPEILVSPSEAPELAS